MDTNEIKQSKTPEELYVAIEKYTAAIDLSDHESVYREARNATIRFRRIYIKLPDLPSHPKNAIAGLQDVMDWCIRAIDIIDHIADEMDVSVINGFICSLDKLKGLPGSGFPKIHKDIWKKAESRANKIVDKYQAGRKRPQWYRRTRLHYATMIITDLAFVAEVKSGKSTHRSPLMIRNIIANDPDSNQIDNTFTEMNFYRSTEKIYRLMDPDYTAALKKLEDNIMAVFNEWNKYNSTETGDLLDKYSELKGIKLQDCVNRIANAYSIESIVDTALFGPAMNSLSSNKTREALVDEMIESLNIVVEKINKKHVINQSNDRKSIEESTSTMIAKPSKCAWDSINNEYDVSKEGFGRKIYFVDDTFKKEIIIRDIEQAFTLASHGFSKPATILAGGVIEELLRLYLEHKNIKPTSDTFDEYIKVCEQNKLLKTGISRLSDSVRHFRNLVHLKKEETERYTISKSTAKGAVASIFTIANDFQ